MDHHMRGGVGNGWRDSRKRSAAAAAKYSVRHYQISTRSHLDAQPACNSSCVVLRAAGQHARAKSIMHQTTRRTV